MAEKANLVSILKTGLILSLYVVFFGALMVITNEMLKEDIAQNKEKERMQLVWEVLPAKLLEKKPEFIEQPIKPDNLLGTDRVGKLYQVVLDGKVVAVVLEAIARGGYGGNIRLLIAVSEDLTLLGVRVLEHKETPAIGDYIAEKPGGKKARVWIGQFKGRSLSNPEESQWAVRKDGGSFDYMGGATISPRAVVKGVKQALLYLRQHQDTLFAAQVKET